MAEFLAGDLLSQLTRQDYDPPQTIHSKWQFHCLILQRLPEVSSQLVAVEDLRGIASIQAFTRPLAGFAQGVVDVSPGGSVKFAFGDLVPAIPSRSWR